MNKQSGKISMEAQLILLFAVVIPTLLTIGGVWYMATTTNSAALQCLQDKVAAHQAKDPYK